MEIVGKAAEKGNGPLLSLHDIIGNQALILKA
jgi:hypothetical protein